MPFGDRPHAAVRLAHVDNLKTLLVAWIIGCHALLGYTVIGGWPYDEVTEVTLPPPIEVVSSLVLGPTALFVIGTFFFLAGLFAPVEMNHRGPTEFLRSRFLRLGVPWLAFMLLIWPFFMWLAYRAAGHSLSYWEAFLGRQPFLDSGPLWFVQVLLYVSVGYGLWAWKRPPRPRGLGGSSGGDEHSSQLRPIGGGHLLMTGVGIALASFLVRLEFPARSQQVLDLHLWQWPQCVGMFCLGVAVSGQSWARAVPPALARRCGIIVLVTPLLAFLLALAAGVRNLARDGAPFLGGWNWQSLALASVEASLVVAGSVWLLAWAQRHLTAKPPILAGADRGAYAAYMLQVPVLISLAIAARPLPIPALGKAVLVGCLAVAGSFWLGWAIAERTRLGRVL
jgi:hypothetical protein